MQKSLRVRRRYPAAEKGKILAAYRRSQLTQKEFAAQAGIGHATLTLWLGQANTARKGSAFVPVPNLFSTAAAPAYRLRFPRGLTVEVAPGFQTGELDALLQLANAL